MRRDALPLALLLCCSKLLASDAPDVHQDVAPILETHCLACHSPNNSKGDVSFDTPAQAIDDGYIVPGDAENSHLLHVVTGQDDTPPRMPKEGEPLTDADVATLKKWIDAGATWPEGLVLRERSKADATWWSLQPLDPSLPDSTAGQKFLRDSQIIDAFIDARLAESGLERNPPADRRTLIRRITFDLIGLPPTPEEVDAFLNDESDDAYERLVDRLLRSPHYGERWGRHWLDVVRFGESNGFERNVIIGDLWPFRDYIIRSFNEDKPFDQLLREHLAGDVLQTPDAQSAIGSAFLVAGPYDNVGNQDAEQAAQIRADTIDEMIRATSGAFLGLTVGCARCHDHKFDPVRQADYYSWYATFSGVRHGSRPLSDADQNAERERRLAPLRKKQQEIVEAEEALTMAIFRRALKRLSEYEAKWVRPKPDRTGTTEQFDPVLATFVRLVSEGQDANPANRNSFNIDEFEVWSAPEPATEQPTNVALAASGAKASGPARQIEDFPGAYGPHLAIDGKLGERFLATGGHLTIELTTPTRIDRVTFSSAKNEPQPDQRKFNFLADYRIEVSSDGKTWTQVASSADRKPVSERHRNERLHRLEPTDAERKQIAQLKRDLAAVRKEMAAVPAPKTVWIGSRSEGDARGPFHLFLGGSPQRKGEQISPGSFAVFETLAESNIDPERLPEAYAFPAGELPPEAERRIRLAEWLVDPQHPLTSRVLANRVWHYHFGTGIVATPSDFGYMGGKPTHPRLLDWLATRLQHHKWRLKPLHRMICLSETYRQASTHRDAAATIDADSRLLWRFPPRRLSAEEIRDAMLSVAGHLPRLPPAAENETPTAGDGGPGFRLYQYLQDNVATYVPLESHGPETYRRAVYHQNARAAVTDLMTDFDQPDCAFSAPRRAQTTTPLQALTLLNHPFTLDMARQTAARLEQAAPGDIEAQITTLWRLCYNRLPTSEDAEAARAFVQAEDLASLTRVLLNTTEFIHVR